jgi:predicted alpha/beta-fold hydrolase
MLSAAARLFDAGFTVFRLNLRDHGDSHQLNRELFNSTRLAEVIGAIGAIIDSQKPQPVFLAGFSLGGNFALRLGLQGHEAGVKLTAVAAVCPLINPAKTTARLEDTLPLYHHYFVKKWKRSLQKKLALFPDLDCPGILLQCRSLRAMHDHFVPRHTNYPTTTAYFSAYTLTGEMFTHMAVPCHIIAADDDPITTTADLDTIGRPPSLSFCRTRHGGHCGFLKDFALRSWADDELLRFFSEFSAR